MVDHYTLLARPYREEEDFWRMRTFLRQVFLLNHRHEYNWPVMRWDYWRWHGILNLGDGLLERDVFIWETAQGELAAFVNRENAGIAFLQVHPKYKDLRLEEEMIAWAENHLKAPSRRGGEALWLFCDSNDVERQELLKSRGYRLVADEGECQWRRDLDFPIPENPIYTGYTLRSLRDESELPDRSWASWRAFHSDQPDENYVHGYTWYLNIQCAPLYRRDLDLVVISPEGKVAAFTTIWYDDMSRCGFFEPVGTVPEHRRRGLASSLLSEGMRRLKVMGATLAIVGGETPHANALYRSVMGEDHDLSQPWEKRW